MKLNLLIPGSALVLGSLFALAARAQEPARTDTVLTSPTLSDPTGSVEIQNLYSNANVANAPYVLLDTPVQWQSATGQQRVQSDDPTIAINKARIAQEERLQLQEEQRLSDLLQKLKDSGLSDQIRKALETQRRLITERLAQIDVRVKQFKAQLEMKRAPQQQLRQQWNIQQQVLRPQWQLRQPGLLQQPLLQPAPSYSNSVTARNLLFTPQDAAVSLSHPLFTPETRSSLIPLSPNQQSVQGNQYRRIETNTIPAQHSDDKKRPQP